MVEWSNSAIAGGLLVTNPNLFKWRRYECQIILLCVRWYLRYSLSYREVEEMMHERGLTVDHTTIFRSRPVLLPRTGEKIQALSAADQRLLPRR